jgi:hypothetical protein
MWRGCIWALRFCVAAHKSGLQGREKPRKWPEIRE